MKIRNKYLGGLTKLISKTSKEYIGNEIWTDNLILSTDYGVTASTGSTQATGYKIKSAMTVITTCANANDSVTLPKETRVGKMFIISNMGANHAGVFPPLNGYLNKLAVNTELQLGTGNSIMYILLSYNASTEATKWARI